MTKKTNIDALNKVKRYTQWISFTVDRSALAALDTETVAKEAEQFFAQFPVIDREDIDEETGVPRLPQGTVIRGVYDVSSMRPEADFMIWWHAHEMEAIQEAFHAFSRTALGKVSTPHWSGTGLHRPSEFNKAHLPAFIEGKEGGGDWISVYPFVRSYEWYLLDAVDRRRILMEHGLMGRKYPDVLANTVYSFALGDYEWMLAFECDDLDQIVELMHAMRYTEARLHVREEVPFHTGRRRSPRELVELFSGA